MTTSKRHSKTKLTLSVNENVLKDAKKTAAKKRIPVSRLVENFLEFFRKPYVYCFKCGDRLDSDDAELCPKCGWMICPKCKACRCELSEETAIAVFYMRRIYEELLAGRVKQ